MNGTQSELRLARLIDERETTHKLHEELLASVEGREQKAMDEVETTQVAVYRERVQELDAEISSLAEAVEHNRTAIEQSKAIRRALSGSGDVEEDGDGVVYRSMAAYARDVILTGNGREAAKIKGILGDKQEVERAEQRLQLLKRTPANTLSGDVPGLIPAAAHRADLSGDRLLEAARRLGVTDDARPGNDLATRTSPPRRSSPCRPRRRPRPETWASMWRW